MAAKGDEVYSDDIALYHRPHEAMSTRSGRKKQGYHHGRLRAALIEAALELVAERGMSALTLRELAREVGVTHAAPYRHFRDKAALMAAMAEEGFGRLTEELRQGRSQALDQALDGETVLRAVGASYLRFALLHPAHYRLMFDAERSGGHHASLGQARATMVAELQLAVETAERSGVLRSGRTPLWTTVLWTQLHGLAVLLNDEHLTVTGALPTEPHADATPKGALAAARAEALVERVVNALLQGLSGDRP